jgi:hypothetical protein
MFRNKDGNINYESYEITVYAVVCEKDGKLYPTMGNDVYPILSETVVNELEILSRYEIMKRRDEELKEDFFFSERPDEYLSTTLVTDIPRLQNEWSRVGGFVSFAVEEDAIKLARNLTRKVWSEAKKRASSDALWVYEHNTDCIYHVIRCIIPKSSKFSIGEYSYIYMTKVDGDIRHYTTERAISYASELLHAIGRVQSVVSEGSDAE